MSKEDFRNNVTHPKNPGSALTHFIGIILVLLASMPLLSRAVAGEHPAYIFSLSIFAVSMLLLYSASTLYHTFNVSEKSNRILRKLDHIMIYVLIAGTYTPILLSAFVPVYPLIGWGLLTAEWGLLAVAVTLTAIDLKKYNVFSMVCYIGMGWGIIFFLPQAIEVLTKQGFLVLLSGGIAYTIGAILYGIGSKKHWMHSIFHIFVVIGSLLQFLSIYFFVL